MRLPAILVAAVALCAPATAHAYTDQQLHAWQAIADQAWNDSCDGRMHAEVVPAGSVGKGVLGQAHVGDTDTCTYWIVDGLDDYEGCVITAHERGHLAGYQSPDPAIDEDGNPDPAHDRGATIMNPEPLSIWPETRPWQPCAAVEPPLLTRDAAISWVVARWPTMWTLDCKRDTLASRMKCWGTALHGKHLRWTLWRDGSYRVRGGKLL